MEKNYIIQMKEEQNLSCLPHLPGATSVERASACLHAGQQTIGLCPIAYPLRVVTGSYLLVV